MNVESTIRQMQAIVDTYHSQAHPLPSLIEMRRELAGLLFFLSGQVKATWVKKEVSHARRKWATSREIVAAMEQDLKAVGTKPRAMNRLEVETEALDHVLQAKKEQAEAEGEWEELRAMSRAAEQVLNAMQQEIADLRHEQNHSNYLDRLAAQERAKDQPTQA